MITPPTTTRSFWKLLCCVGVACLFAASCRLCRALDGSKELAQCRMDTWTTRDGLPPRSIESMAQTPDGYLWLATRAGLVRFDGVTFTVYHAQNTPGFTRGMVRAVAVDRKGTLWLGTDGDGFGTFRDGVYTRFAVGPGTPAWSETRAICPARDGSVWVGGVGANNLAHIREGHAEIIANAPHEIYALMEQADGSLWLACGRYGVVHQTMTGRFVPLLDERKQPFVGAESLCLDREEKLWIGCDQAGLYRASGGCVTRMLPANDTLKGKAASLCADEEGNIWIGCQDALYRWRQGGFRVFRKGDGLGQGQVGAMLEDREGNLWAGTGAALTRFNNTKLTPFVPPLLGTASINALAQTRDGSVWVGATDGLLRQRQGQWTRVVLPQGLEGKSVQSLCGAQDGALWLTTDQGALLSYYQERWTRYHSQADQKYVMEDAQGLVFQDWTNLYRLRNGKFVRIPDQQPCGFIFSYCRDSRGTLWFGSENGLGCVRPNHIEMYHQGLPANTHVLCLVADAKDTLWLGTDKGLARWAGDRFTLFTARDGLPDDNSYQIACDAQGTLYVGGNRGIFAVKTGDLEAYAHGNYAAVPTTLYEAADGIRQFPVTHGGALRTDSGAMWFKGDTGVTIVDPRRIVVNRIVPNVRIERVVLDGRLLPADKSGLSAAPGKGELEIRYTGLSLTAPEKVRFHYQLEGFDKGWVDAGTRRAAYYTNLPPGEYRFRVMACNNDGYWNSQGATLRFTLRPRFTQTPLARVLAILAVSGAGLGAAWLRLRRLRHANRSLEARIVARTAELLAANQELHASHQSVQEANIRLHSLATTDGMTGLANHRAFQEALREALAAAECDGSPCALLLADVDHFKQYNDAYGHPAGDEALRVAADVLKECVGEGDLVARYGGEEFAVLLPGADSVAALQVAERIRAAIAAGAFPCRCVTMSIGAASLAGEDYTAKTLIRRADEALYAAKRGGRNRVMMVAHHAQQSCVDRELADVTASAEREAEAFLTLEPAAAAVRAGGGEQTLAGLMAVLNLRDPETDGHSQRVARYALRLAQEVIRQSVAPLTPDDLRDLTLGALLHDVGKIGVPDAILHKPGALTEAEWEIMRRHPQQGAEILSAFSHLVSALPVVRSHHERWDGGGYPDGLVGEQIPLAARLFALADTLDAMSSDRPYRAALGPEAIEQEISDMAGVQFDPALVRVFLSIPRAEWKQLESVEYREAQSPTAMPPVLRRAA